MILLPSRKNPATDYLIEFKRRRANAQSSQRPSEVLGENFHAVLSSSNCSSGFTRWKTIQERPQIRTSGGSAASYNQPFTMPELKQAFSSIQDFTPGADNAHHEMLWHLNKKALEVLMHFFNSLWLKCRCPKTGK